MGRKTNSVSLRLKKTNRDYNNCWYSDMLYAESFSKSLKIDFYLSQTFKTLSVPCPRTSVIGAFKKAVLLVCYLDPKKRKRLLEKCSKGLQSKARTLQVSKNQSSKKAFLSLGQVKQESKDLLKPLNALLQTNGEAHARHGWGSLQYRWEGALKANHSSLYSANSALNPNKFSLQASHFVTQEGEEAFVSIAPGLDQVNIKEEKFHVKRKEKQKTDKLSKTIYTKINYCYRGPISLDLVLNKEFALNDLSFISSQQIKPLLSFYNICNFLCFEKGLEIKKQMPCKDKASKTNATRISLFESLCLKKNNALNNNNTPPEPFVLSSLAHFKTGNCFSLKGNFFVKKQEKSLSGNCNLLGFNALDSLKVQKYQGEFFNPLLSKNVLCKKGIKASEVFFLKAEKANQAYKESALQKNATQSSFSGLNFFPFFFFKNKEKEKACFRFQNFSQFFYNEISNLALISAFSKNNQIFGKKQKGKDLERLVALKTGNQKDYGSDMILATNKCERYVMPLATNNNQRAIISKPKGFNFAFSKKKENCSLTSLYGFYNGISSFWGNLVSLSFYKSTNETSCALFLAECVGYLLEKKVSFRSLKRQLLLELHQSKYSLKGEKTSVFWDPQLANKTNASQAHALPFLGNSRKVTGIRIICSGRVGGRSKKAQRSRKDTFMWGETGLHVFSSKLDFAKTHAETPFGLVGVQVWVCTK